MTEIRTARLLIRRAEPGDLADVHAILSDADAMRYWATPPHTSLEESHRWLAAMITAPADISDDYVIVRAGKVIGKAGCWRVPEIGYVFHPTAWGKGYAFEALEALIARILATRAISEIVADVDPRNEASLRLLGRLGFAETGRAERTMEIGGEWCDSVYLALTRKGFAGRSAPQRP